VSFLNYENWTLIFFVYNNKMSKKILLFIIIPFLLLLIIGIIIYIVKHNSHSKSNQKKVMFGLALQTNISDEKIIDLAKLKGKITCFWNWKSMLTLEQLKKQYNWTPDLNIQFLPMLWGSSISEPHLPSDYNYVMLSNEPDMIGGCVDPSKSPCSDATAPATSSGYWIHNGDYGCFSEKNDTITECTPDSIIKQGDKNTFSYLIDKFIGQCENLKPNTIVVSPAMSQNARGTCDAYKTTFDGDVPTSITTAPNKCTDTKGCTCNGWLSLLKAAALAGTTEQTNWWNNTLKIISIHAYYKYSHHVKNKILQYMDEFKDDIDKGKQIWLTEVAYVSTNDTSDNMKTYIKESADFAKTLLYANTNPSSIPSTCSDRTFVLPGVDLPGLLTTTPFLFNGKTASWFDHGLTCVTWFCVEDWANFPTYCNGVTSTGQISSYPFTDGPTGEPNALYYSLFP